MKKRIEKKLDAKRVLGVQLGESTILAIRRRALDETEAMGANRSMGAICTDALLAYLATPLPRAQRSA